jgi:hypothetical protein
MFEPEGMPILAMLSDICSSCDDDIFTTDWINNIFCGQKCLTRIKFKIVTKQNDAAPCGFVSATLSIKDLF